MKLSPFLQTTLTAILFAAAKPCAAQLPPCQQTIGVTSINQGSVSLYATQSNSASTGTYYWNFGNNQVATTTVNTVAHTFTANGNYTVTLNYLNSALTCSSVAIYTLNISGVSSCSLTASYSVTQAGNTVTVTSTSTGTNATSSYQWFFGNGSGSGPTAVNTYTNNGVYMLALTVTSGTCTATSPSTPIVVCTGSAGVSANVGANGLVSFSLAVTPPMTNGFYGWQYGDGISTWTSVPVSTHIYTANGTYTVSAFGAIQGCTLSTQYLLTLSNITAPCNINANFNTINSMGNFMFTNSSSGTNAGTTYQWDFGDGNTSTAASPTHSYTGGGTYTVTMIANNNYSYTCADTAVSVVSIPACNFSPTLASTTGANGLVNFNVTAPGTVAICYYNFGDGTTGASNTGFMAHTYTANGTYSVTVNVQVQSFPPSFCGTTLTGVVTVTNVCTADASFSLAPSGTPQLWNVIPASPGNVASAEWNWGDGNTSSTLYTSHTYSAAGLYSICLTVTTTCGAVDTSCATWNIYRPADGTSNEGFIQIQVVDANAVGLLQAQATAFRLELAPNPGTGLFKLILEGNTSSQLVLRVHNSLGQEVFEKPLNTADGATETDLDLQQLAPGVYYLSASNGKQTLNKKLVIAKN